MEDVGARLDKAAKLGGFRSRRQMAQELEINYRTMVNWVERNKITEKGALTIASKIPISQHYLLTGKGRPESFKECTLSHAQKRTPRASDMVRLFEELDDDDKRFVFKIAMTLASANKKKEAAGPEEKEKTADG